MTLTKIAGSRSISQDPAPYQNVTDPQQSDRYYLRDLVLSKFVSRQRKISPQFYDCHLSQNMKNRVTCECCVTFTKFRTHFDTDSVLFFFCPRSFGFSVALGVDGDAIDLLPVICSILISHWRICIRV
jgi:hypothetical protein